MNLSEIKRSSTGTKPPQSDIQPWCCNCKESEEFCFVKRIDSDVTYCEVKGTVTSEFVEKKKPPDASHLIPRATLRKM